MTKEMMEKLLMENIEIKKELSVLKENKIDYNQASGSTYADQVKSNGSVVLITPNDNNQKSERTKEVVKERINPAENNITKMWRGSKGAIIIECKDKKSSEKLQSSAIKNLGAEYKIELPKKRKPKFKLCGMSDRLTDDQLIDLLIKQNECLKMESELKVVKTIESKDRYDNTKFKSIIETNAETYKQIMNIDKLYVNWDSCKVFEHVNITRCYKCLGFNHFSKDCKKETTCKLCAGNHMASTCSTSSQNYKCVNCSYHVDHLKMQLDTNHHAFSSECKVLQRKIIKEKKKVDLYE